MSAKDDENSFVPGFETFNFIIRHALAWLLFQCQNRAGSMAFMLKIYLRLRAMVQQIIKFNRMDWWTNIHKRKELMYEE